MSKRSIFSDRERALADSLAKNFGLEVHVRLFSDAILVTHKDGRALTLKEERICRRLGQVDGVQTRPVSQVTRAMACDPATSEEGLLDAWRFYPKEVRANPAATLYAIADPEGWVQVFE